MNAYIYCIIGIAVCFVIGAGLFFLWSLCAIAADSNRYQLHDDPMYDPYWDIYSESEEDESDG